jgi:osmotically-inducible protein OsmY
MRYRIERVLLSLFAAGAFILSAADKKIETFNAYVDADICAHLMLGPITPEREECSRKTVKDGDQPVVVRLRDNFVLEVNKAKMVKEHVGGLAEVTGEVKAKDGKVNLQAVKGIDKSAIPPDSPEGQVLDVRHFKLTGAQAATREKVRHELAMMPYISEFDFISFTMNGGNVTLTGWTVRVTNRSTAENLVKRIEGVESVTNNIEVLPLGRNDMQIRAGVRAALQRFLSRYFWGSGSAIKIIVKNGNIILLGMVATKADSDIAYVQSSSVPMAFKVFNLLKVEAGGQGKK